MAAYDTSAVEVVIIYDEVRGPAEILTISSSGIFVKTGLLLELGSEVELEFSSLGEIVVMVRAQVTRIEPQTGTDEEIGLGLRYQNMHGKTWMKLEKHLMTAPGSGVDNGSDSRVGLGSTSQKFRVLNQATDLKIKVLLAEIDDLQRELAHRLNELQDLLSGSE